MDKLSAGQSSPTAAESTECEAGAIHSQTLVRSSESWNGVPYIGYGQGKPELTVLRIEIPPNSYLPWHRHVVPNAAYVVSGHMNVEDRASGQKMRVDAGQAFNEQVGHVHRGFTDDEPAVVVVTYAGTSGVPLSIQEEE
tara:strand:- start:1742 stop:2158 length:417 start_codon:yes stop_codon:yes gene_type:complete